MPGPIPLAVALDIGGTQVAGGLVTGDGKAQADADPVAVAAHHRRHVLGEPAVGVVGVPLRFIPRLMPAA